MPSDRRRRILAALAAESTVEQMSTRLCEVSTDIIGVTGTGIMIMSGELPGGSLCATDEVSSRIEDLQFMLGEGPCVEAHERGEVVVEPDLANPRIPRWLAFSPAAFEAGARALFAFPLRVGLARIGALNLYRDLPGPLTDDQHTDTLVVAELVAQRVLDVAAGAIAGAVPEEHERGADFHFVVHNAAGMVSVQLGVSVIEALIRLRAYAFRSGRPLRNVAEEVVAHLLWIG